MFLRSPTRPRGALAPRGWRAVLVLLLGVLLTGLGVGVGVPHAVKTGWSAPAVSGLVALVVGLLLVGLALAGLTRSVRGWRRLLVLPAAGLVAVTLVYVLAVPLAVTTVAPTRVDYSTLETLGADLREVRLPPRDGVELAGSYVPSRNGAAVVLLHGSGSTRSSVVDEAEVLAANGYGVLLLDGRGHGDSGGRAMDWGWYGDDDVSAAVDFLESQPDVDPGRMAAVGLSMGGEEAVGALAAEPRLRAVVAEGVTGRGAHDLQWLSDLYGWRGEVTEYAKWLQTWLADLLSGADRPVALRDSVAVAERPVLLVAAGSDPDEQHAADVLRAAAPDSVRVWVVEGSGHTQGLATAPEEWASRVVGFLEAATG